MSKIIPLIYFIIPSIDSIEMCIVQNTNKQTTMKKTTEIIIIIKKSTPINMLQKHEKILRL